MVPPSAIRIRDPFVVAVPREGTYYLYGTTDESVWSGPGVGFDVWRGRDLASWEGPRAVFRPSRGFWGTTNFWAPEVFVGARGPLMLASFKDPTARRAVQLLVAESPLGPFVPRGAPLTPARWECLDGSLHVEDGVPWLVFCREWTEVGDGTIHAAPLAGDLSAPIGEPALLFAASSAPWVRRPPTAERDGCFVTDGPFLWRSPAGRLHLLWSSFGPRGYALGRATSRSGSIRGPWDHAPEPLFADDGGHGMIFDDLAGRPTLVLHAPNVTPRERPRFFDVEEDAALALRITPRERP